MTEDSASAVASAALHPQGHALPGRLVRLCLAQGAPTFIPFAEPWRNGVVEYDNDTVDKKFFHTEHFVGIDGLTGQVEWIRPIRSDRQLHVLEHALAMPESVVSEYVASTLVVEHDELVVTHHEREIARHPFPLS